MTSSVCAAMRGSLRRQAGRARPRDPGRDEARANGPRRALESLRRDSIDCVILDLEMPGMDGFEVLRSVERLGLRVPVIVYTGTGDFDRCVQALRPRARPL